ncbi:MAG: hypothetical protein ACU841_10720 [Gammaproteobacteria bacterium]
MLAPIGLTVYGRTDHIRKAVEALQKNTLAQDSVLYIFSDAPKPGDEEKVAGMRSYIKGIDGFRQVNIVERRENSRLLNNRGGQQYLLQKYGKMIWLAEDVVTAPGFLRFMNEALDFYRDNPRIGSISGYCPPIPIPEAYVKDFFTLPSMNPWGVGLWRHYYRMNTPITREAFSRVFRDRKSIRRLESSVGEAAAHFIRTDYEGRADAGDMKSIFWQYVEGRLTVYPRISLVKSIGQDDSGVHMGRTNKWDVARTWDKVDGFEFSDEVEVDEEICKAHAHFYRINKGKMQLIEILNRLGLYSFVKPVAKSIRKLGVSIQSLRFSDDISPRR